jgi:FkbM family methyltransferase
MLIPDVFTRFPNAAPRRGVLHVGAHMCEEAELYDSLGMNARDAEKVLWVEANADIAAQAANAGQFPNIVCAAVSETDGAETTFFITNNGQSSSLLPLAEHRREHPDVYEVAAKRVRTITLDTLFEKLGIPHDRYDVANLDIQGAELMALRGAEKILANLRAIYTEVNTKELYAGCALLPEMDEFLEARGFVRVALEMTAHGWGDAIFIRKEFA